VARLLRDARDAVVRYGSTPASDGKQDTDVRTTMIYTHVLNVGPQAVRSPLDR
jgi:hypothetical protein